MAYEGGARRKMPVMWRGGDVADNPAWRCTETRCNYSVQQRGGLREDDDRPKHGQNISYMDAEIIGSYFEEMLQTLRLFRLATLELFTPRSRG